MTTRTVTTITLVAGIALGIALDRHADKAIRPLGANQVAVPVAQSTGGALTDEEATTIRVARELTPTVVSVTRQGGSGSGIIVSRDGRVVPAL